MIVFRHADPRYPFLWEDDSQPPGRWHAEGEGPTQYFADTPDGAWAEFLRHEEITTAEDLATVRRAVWAVEIADNEPAAAPDLPLGSLTGGRETYDACRVEARRSRARGATKLIATAAALLPGGASGWRVRGGLRPGEAREGKTIVLFGARPDAVGWAVTVDGRPPDDLLPKVRHFARR